MYDHILIPTDGSDLAHKGVEQGLSLAKMLGSKVTIIMVTERFPILGATADVGWFGSPVDYDRYDENRRQFANGVLSAAKISAENIEVAANTVHVADAHPATAILETAANLGCNLIVMASHGRRGIERLLLGSQTAEVLANSHVAVLVVR